MGLNKNKIAVYVYWSFIILCFLFMCHIDMFFEKNIYDSKDSFFILYDENLKNSVLIEYKNDSLIIILNK